MQFIQLRSYPPAYLMPASIGFEVQNDELLDVCLCIPGQVWFDRSVGACGSTKLARVKFSKQEKSMYPSKHPQTSQ